ncbi:helix-turn-helix transcriptional regulator [Actinomadura alba]|uniref:Helix-turn-helix transcriptional regulator n=1 Tax=Actinomadura alba TaxID=406431 RepID=A0ABR7LMT0_9ACTN|nr:helix-turn-helix transcriptional regulator [Actinomadura alba]MBC6466008.1 helix-turn-helix transcriptional regulator [Actinomadura alba]
MAAEELLKRARLAAGKTQADIAWAAGTSRTTLSAYEHGRKSPTLDTAERIVEAAGYEFALDPRVEFTDHLTRRGRPFSVPDRLFRLPLDRAFAKVVLPLHLNWSDPGAEYDLSNPADRRLVFQRVLLEGLPEDIRRYVDGALLIDLWPELVLPTEIREAWVPLVEHVVVR